MPEMIVVFAHWCPTCNMMMPIAEEVAADYQGRLKVEWIDVDKNPEILEKYDIQIVPTFIIRRAGNEVARMAGMIGEKKLRERIDYESRV